MSWIYKVVPVFEVVENPSIWQRPSSRIKEVGTAIQNTINQMADEGWEYTDSCTIGLEYNYLVFRRKKESAVPSVRSDAFKEA
jgi:hypothetical protein